MTSRDVVLDVMSEIGVNSRDQSGAEKSRNPQETCAKRLTSEDLNLIFQCPSGKDLNKLLTDLYERAKRGKRSLWSVVNLALARVGKGFDFYGSYCRISAEERLTFHKNIIGLEGEQFTIVKSELFSMLSKSVSQVSEADTTAGPLNIKQASAKRTFEATESERGGQTSHGNAPIVLEVSLSKRSKSAARDSVYDYPPIIQTDTKAGPLYRISKQDLKLVETCPTGHDLNDLLSKLYENTRPNRASVWSAANAALNRIGKGIKLPGELKYPMFQVCIYNEPYVIPRRIFQVKPDRKNCFPRLHCWFEWERA
jgi:plasmid maintenance system killer protein